MDDGPFRPDAINRAEATSPLVIAAATRHYELTRVHRASRKTRRAMLIADTTPEE